jgi:hypothetical protein
MPVGNSSPWGRPDLNNNDPTIDPLTGQPFVDPKTGKPYDKSDAESWYRDTIQAHPEKYDTNIAKEVWLSWFPAWDAGKKLFKLQKLDGGKQPFTGDSAYGDKPTDCPQGTQAWGDTQCLPPGDARLLSGQPTAAPAVAAKAANTAITQGKAGTLTLTGNKLVDMLLQQFNNRQSLDRAGDPDLFGWAGGRIPVGVGGDLPNAYGRLLDGGGLLWSNDPATLGKADHPPKINTLGNAMPNPAGLPPPPPPPDVTGGPASVPVVKPFSRNPSIQALLMNKRNQGSFLGDFSSLFPTGTGG